MFKEVDDHSCGLGGRTLGCKHTGVRGLSGNFLKRTNKEDRPQRTYHPFRVSDLGKAV